MPIYRARPLENAEDNKLGAHAAIRSSQALRFLFVITYGRSGSTMLLNVLNSLDGFCIRGENSGVATYLAKAAACVSRAREKHSDHAGVPQSPWFGIDDVDPIRLRQNLARVLVDDILSPPRGARTVGFKEVRYSSFDFDDQEYQQTLDFLADGFPEARFIFNTRNWEEVSNSGWWRYLPSRREIRKIIEDADRRFSESATQLGNRAFKIDYSQFKDTPAGFRPLLDWLGETVSDEQLAQIASQKLNHLSKSQEDRGRWLRLRRQLF